jgi:hypothetical protein
VYTQAKEGARMLAELHPEIGRGLCLESLSYAQESYPYEVIRVSTCPHHDAELQLKRWRYKN